MSDSLSNIGGIRSTTRQFVDHIGIQITGKKQLKGEKSGFQFPGRKHNLRVGDTAYLVCKQLALVSSILKLEHRRFLISLAFCCLSFCPSCY